MPRRPAAAEGSDATEFFMNAASPGVITAGEGPNIQPVQDRRFRYVHAVEQAEEHVGERACERCREKRGNCEREENVHAIPRAPQCCTKNDCADEQCHGRT
jgi:hypothetical protein